MTPEERARDALEKWGDAVYAAVQAGADPPSSVGFIAAAIRAAELDALEQAARLCALVEPVTRRREDQ